ncbi:MAG: hypothetical protein R3C11_12990 [Planctomycetaceae bacterium]
MKTGNRRLLVPGDDPLSNRGGFVGDAGSHKIDCLFYATGLEPVEVLAWTDCCGSKVEITAQSWPA